MVLLTVDSTDASIVLDKLSKLNTNSKSLKPVSNIVRMSTWSLVLQCCHTLLGPRYDQTQDLEDFYTEQCGNLSGYITALDVANCLRKAVKKLCLDYLATKEACSLSNEQTARNCFIQALSNPRSNHNSSQGWVREGESGTKVDAGLTASVHSTFRPAVSSRIGMVRMETVDLSSDSEEDLREDIEVKRQMVKKLTRKMPLNVTTRASSPCQQPLSKIPRRMLKCQQCDQSFDNSASLKIHRIMHTRNSITISKTTREYNPNQLPVKKKLIRLKMCQQCNKTFENAAFLEIHMKKMHSVTISNTSLTKNPSTHSSISVSLMKSVVDMYKQFRERRRE